MKDLKIKFKANFKESFKSYYRYRNHSNSSSDYKKIKLPNILLFNLKVFIKQRNEWLIDLKQIF